ncbi:MerR family transcriptional regulator [Actinokineospora auranticolor]|uniref:DNA-binding transcriptional MerR regulator n=1 Tax=Actinokineospora auranticolor TaxID=155976 RepID=A0A2S6GC84_9PSEU|nr:MerR family transcriptional regulator [Actinokineospora auranticolor]PPK62216.1 DNA-binding transcriptional MerR regulator [Actinokineospora auranticolor]
MRIGELAQATGTTPRAVRHYEHLGLIASERLHNGYRDYDDAVVARVRNIRYLLAAGLTLDDIQAFGPCLDGDMRAVEPSEAGIQVARNRLEVLNRRIDAQVEVRDKLAAALRALV